MNRMSFTNDPAASCSRFDLDPLESRMFLDAAAHSFLLRVETHVMGSNLIKIVFSGDGALKGIVQVSMLPSASPAQGPSLRTLLTGIIKPTAPAANPPAQVSAPQQVVAASPEAVPPMDSGIEHSAQPSLARTVLTENAPSRMARSSRGAAAPKAAAGTSMAARGAWTTRLVFAPVFSNVQIAGTPAQKVAPNAPHAPQPVASDTEASLPIIQKLVDATTRTFQIADFGSPMKLLSDSIAAFADECASLPFIAEDSRHTSAWAVTAAVVAADLALGAYALHRAAHRRQAQTAHVYHSSAPRW